MSKEQTVDRIREFNRFYLPKMALLGKSYLGSEYPVAEARILYEVYARDGCNAAYLCRRMNLDKGYISRVIRAHEKSGYIIRERSSMDTRSYVLHLTDAGRERAEDFNAKSNAQIGQIISCLSEEDCRKVMEDMNHIMEILGKCANAGKV